jgi:hypothetical protein
MVARSQNGYIAIPRSGCVTIRVGRNLVPIPVRNGVVAEVFVAFLNEYDRSVEELLAGQCWGWAYRDIRGSSTTLSNHASGTAVDGNSLLHMRGVKNTFTAAKMKRVRVLYGYLSDPVDGEPVLRWGEDYSSVIDGMHHEIHKADEVALRRALNHFLESLEKEKDPPKGGGETDEPPAWPLRQDEYFGLGDGDGPGRSGHAEKLPNGKQGSKDLLTVQRRFRDRGWTITTNGLYTDDTKRVVIAFQKEKKLDADGLIGPKTWAAAWAAPIT